MVNDKYRSYGQKFPNQNFRNFFTNGKQPEKMDRKLVTWADFLSSIGCFVLQDAAALDGSIIVEICDETMAGECGVIQSKCRVCLPSCCSFSEFLVLL